MAAIIVEPIQLSNAVALIPKSYFQGIRRLCDKYDVLMIADEVATGFGRSGKMFASDRWGTYPHILNFAKTVTNGYIPLGGVMVTDKIYQSFLGTMESGKELSHGYTSSGSALACAAAIATLDYFDDLDLISRIRDKADILKQGMESIGKSKCIETVEGIGFMYGIKFKEIQIKAFHSVDLGAFVESALKRKGILVYYEGFGKMFIAPPLTSSDRELDHLIQVVEKVIRLVDHLMDT